MGFIKIGKVNMKILIPIISGTIRLMYRYFISEYPKNTIIKQNPLIMSIYSGIGMSLAIIPFLIVRFRTNNICEGNNHYSEKELEYLHYDVTKQKQKQRIKLYAIAIILDTFQTLLVTVYSFDCPYNLWIFDMIPIYVFSYFILKTKFYNHQYLCMIIITIFGFILNVLEYFKLDDSKKEFKIQEVLCKFLSELVLSLDMVVAKYNMLKTFCSPYQICIIKGIATVVIYIICLLIFNSFGWEISEIKYPDNFYEYFNGYDKDDFIIFFVMIVQALTFNMGLLLACDYFGPYLFLIIPIIHELYFFFNSDLDIALNILGIIVLLLVLFIFLFFTDIIEFNFCNVSFNTKKNIELRGESDTIMMLMDFKDDDDEDEEEL